MLYVTFLSNASFVHAADWHTRLGHNTQQAREEILNLPETQHARNIEGRLETLRYSTNPHTALINFDFLIGSIESVPNLRISKRIPAKTERVKVCDGHRSSQSGGFFLSAYRTESNFMHFGGATANCDNYHFITRTITPAHTETFDLRNLLAMLQRARNGLREDIQEAARQAEAARRQAEANRIAEQQRVEAVRQAEANRQEAARQAAAAQAETQRQAAIQAAARQQAEANRVAEQQRIERERLAEANRVAEAARQEVIRLAEAARQAEADRQAELARQAAIQEAAHLAEQQRQEQEGQLLEEFRNLYLQQVIEHEALVRNEVDDEQGRIAVNMNALANETLEQLQENQREGNVERRFNVVLRD